MDQASQSLAIDRCLETLANLSGFHIAELWTKDNGGFTLVHGYIDHRATRKYAKLIGEYHSGELQNSTSTNMCKRAMQAKHGFYWIAKHEKALHADLPVHTAASHYLPRDNVNGDVFIVLYSLFYIKVRDSRLVSLTSIVKEMNFKFEYSNLIFSSYHLYFSLSLSLTLSGYLL
jgi:hypothetical protein